MAFTPNIIPYPHYIPATFSIPSFYFDGWSQEQRWHYLCKELRRLCQYANDMGIQVNLTADKINELEAQFEEFKENGFADYYEQQVKEWIAENTELIFKNYTRGVYFGLNQEGYFVAYIPESWSDVVFDTGMDASLDTYGRLILRMDVDSPENVDQTRETVQAITDDELTLRIRNIMQTLYSVGG